MEKCKNVDDSSPDQANHAVEEKQRRASFSSMTEQTKVSSSTAREEEEYHYAEDSDGDNNNSNDNSSPSRSGVWSNQTVVPRADRYSVSSTVRDMVGDDSRDFSVATFSAAFPPPPPPSSVSSSSLRSSKQAQNSPRVFHRPSNRKVNQLDDSFTINQLKFSQDHHQLVGRDAEIQMLQNALTRVHQHQGKELVLLHGYSGTGKTALAKTLRKSTKSATAALRASASNNTAISAGLYVQGKFDSQKRNNQPYAAIAMAVGALCAQLLILQQTQAQRFLTIRTALEEALGPSDLPLLVRVFGVLQELWDDDLQGQQQQQGQEEKILKQQQQQNPLEAKRRLVYAFCRFMRVMTGAFSPLVLVLDDLQWADGPSLDLIEAILLDRNESSRKRQRSNSGSDSNSASSDGGDGLNATAGLLLIGIYRSNEVDKAHLLSSRLREWKQRATPKQDDPMDAGPPFLVQDIPISNLPFSAVHEFINGVLSITGSQNEDNNNTLGLADLCHRRTHGNVFFLIHFLRMLHRDQLLRYNFGTLQWNWDVKEIEDHTVASDNVVDLLMQKMDDLTVDQADLLRMAACLGASFAKETLQLLWDSRNKQGGFARRNSDDGVYTMYSSDDDNPIEDMDVALQELIADGYLQVNERGLIQFSHDKVEEAASMLKGDRHQDTAEFHKWVGKVLLAGLKSQDLESAVFVVVNLLNDGEKPKDSEERRQLAELNRRAGNKAMSLSAYEAASTYVSKGISLLGDNAWTEQYELALDLFSTGAEAEASLGNVVMMDVYCKTVIDLSDKPMEDKLRVYTTWLASLANRGHMREAADETLRLLAKFGVKFPKRKFMQAIQTISNLSKVKKGLKGDLLKTIKSLPLENDATRIKLLHLLDRLSVYLYYMHDDLMPLVMFRNFQWTLKYGMNDVTPPALTTMGIIYAGILGDLQSGSDLAKTALELIPKVSPLVEPRTLFTAHGFGVAYTEPMRDQLKPLLRAYELGLCTGDTESACWAIHLFYHMRYLTSFSLDLCIADVEMYMPQMKELNQVVAYRSTLVNYQMFMNLAGRTDTDPLSLSGKYCTPENHQTWCEQDPFYYHHCLLWECYVRTIYGEHVECAKLVQKYGNNTVVKSNPGTFSMDMFEVFSKGISCSIAARVTKKRAFRKDAMAIHRRIKNWIEKGNPNVAHLDAFLDGQMSAAAGKKFAAIKSFQVAIVIAARGGLIMDAAMFSECFGEYLLEVDDRDEAVFRLREAIKYYREFGAFRKVSLLEEKHANLWPKPEFVTTVRSA